MGDLVRYNRDLLGSNFTSSGNEWKLAASYYQQALNLIPDQGNPQNQLAVLCTYVDMEFDAVYHYFYSLGVLHPFLTAKENLLVLFDKNRIRYETFLKSEEE